MKRASDGRLTSCVTLAIGLFCCSFLQGRAAEFNVAAGVFIDVINEDGRGPYQLILREAARRAGIDIVEQVYPLKRAIRAFTEKEVIAIYGMTDAVLVETSADRIITSFPLGVYKLYIFSRKGETPLSSYTMLQSKTLGGVLGYEAYYRELEKHNVNIEYIANESLQLNKLRKKRIDAVLGFMPDWIPVLNELSYDPAFAVVVGYDYMTVWNTEEGQRFVAKISPALLSMKKDGSLQKILGERYMDFDYAKSKEYEWNPEPSVK